ncbi:MAG: (Fe-S)-binding protein [Candidatus Thorarchaeota archaeon]|nr:(Fe-S)-binding protein [Candidatus Thorarchaeota archaeon]
MSEDEAYEYVKGTLKQEGIIPYNKHELEVVKSIENCINCGLCINHCPVVRAVGVDRFTGPRGIAVELSRSAPEFWTSVDRIYLCTGCGTCREVCPNNVDIPELVNLMRARIYKQHPELVPASLHEQMEILNKHDLAFEPWDDPEEKIESRDMRLERIGLPFVEDRVKAGADVLFYPGCQAEERSQEVREAAKVILEHFNVSYTLLDEMSCCGLPTTLIGDHEKTEDLSQKLLKKIKDLGVKKIVTTCAGCTSNLNELAIKENWNIPVYHMLEYLVEDIGIDTLANEFGKKREGSQEKVTVHDPCHLIRHTSRQVMDYAHMILTAIPLVEVRESELHDSCCGGGGLVGRHAPDVARGVVKSNVAEIESTGSDRVVTPCPLCTAQLEENLFREGSKVEVDDLTVFIAKSLPLEG